MVYIDSTQGVAGRMIGEQTVPFRTEVSDVELVHEIFGEFKDAFSKRFSAWIPLLIPFKKFQEIVSEMMGAGARWCDDISAGFLEYFDGMFCDGARIGS